MEHGRVAVVTVTYSARSHLAIGTLRRALEVGAACVVVVVNGSPPEHAAAVEAEARRHPAGRVIVRVERQNLGSSGGFILGLETARDLPEIDQVWLLDDDNRPADGALALACDRLHRLEEDLGTGCVAVVCARPYHDPHRNIREGLPARSAYSRPGAALGFDIRSRFQRDRAFGHRPDPSVPVEVPMAPYGGLLLPRDILNRVGLPRADFILYSDDYEYVVRLRDHGIRTFLLLDAAVDDIESPVRGGPGPRELVRLLRTPRDAHPRIYYQLRNDLVLDRHRARSWATRGLLIVNLSVYLTAVLAFAARSRENRNAVPPIFAAVRDGLLGRLGRTVPLRF